jgi:hypothetical protein
LVAPDIVCELAQLSVAEEQRNRSAAVLGEGALQRAWVVMMPSALVVRPASPVFAG